jgi:hypothetical protein
MSASPLRAGLWLTLIAFRMPDVPLTFLLGMERR